MGRFYPPRNPGLLASRSYAQTGWERLRAAPPKKRSCLESHRILPSPPLISRPSSCFRFLAGTGSLVGGAGRRKTQLSRSRDSAVAAVPVPATDRRGSRLK
ncbi:hypothetical protein MJG53_008937, partial [Ovis ammon polii x Ovis aries]